jgi:hypothetical protein
VGNGDKKSREVRLARTASHSLPILPGYDRCANTAAANSDKSAGSRGGDPSAADERIFGVERYDK